jgi:hypothetical protein
LTGYIKRIRRPGPVALIEEVQNSLGIIEGKDDLEELGVNRKIILKFIFKVYPTMVLVAH